LCDGAAETGEDFYRELATLASAFAAGRGPDALRPIFFGARLIGLLKKDGGIRPIACGDVFRRLAGRLLAKRVKR
jgi:hypothetical protein